jgi:receptor expression-enhancing protein 5/6
MSAGIPQLEQIREFMHKNPTVKKYADMAEEKTKVPIEYLVCGLAIIPLIMVYYGWFDRTICNLIGFGYPTYATIVALEKNKADSEFWLTYWIVFSLFNIIDFMLDTLFFWFKYFYLLKMAFILCLYLPQTNLAKIIFDKAVYPAYKSVEQVLDDVTK